MLICLCGVLKGSPHATDCPYPEYGTADGLIDAWAARCGLQPVVPAPAAFDPLRVRVSISSAANHGRSFDLLINGAVVIAGESFAVCDSVREALYGHRAGVCGELLEVADVILSRLCRDCGVLGATRATCPRDICGGPIGPRSAR